MPKTLAIIGTLDTKGQEVAFLRDWIQATGHRVCVIDSGVLDQPTIEAGVTRHQVARAGGVELADLIATGDKGRAMQAMMDGTRAIVMQLLHGGQTGRCAGCGRRSRHRHRNRRDASLAYRRAQADGLYHHQRAKNL